MTRLWGEGKFSSFDSAFFSYMQSLKMDAVWFTGIPRHATAQPFVKGNPGSPYAVCDYLDTNPYLADRPERRLEEFRELVQRAHEAGLKVVTDIVPNHVSPDAVNGIPVYDGWDYDWSDTRKIDWSNPQTLPKMAEILRFWAGLGVDGFRFDMVELVPLQSLADLLREVRRDYPALLCISEVYNMDSYGEFIAAGFDLLYDKSGFYDSARAILTQGDSAQRLTWNWQRLGASQPKMLNFLENHDEQRFASPAFAGAPGKAYAAMAFATLFNDASVMLYFGQEVGESAAEAADGRTSIFNWCKPESVGRLYRELHREKALTKTERSTLARYRKLMRESAKLPFSGSKNYDLCWCQGEGFDRDRQFAFVRYKGKRAELVVCNFSSEAAEVRVRTPQGESFPAAEFEVQLPAYDYKTMKI